MKWVEPDALGEPEISKLDIKFGDWREKEETKEKISNCFNYSSRSNMIL